MRQRLQTFVRYGRLKRAHPDWPYVVGDLLCLLWLAVVLAFLTGCVATGTKVTDEQLMHLERGTTSCFDLVAQLGTPTLTERTLEGTRILTYSYTQAQLKPANFIPVVALFTQGATSETTTVTVFCDAQNRYAGHTASQGQTQMGTGFTSGARQ